ncbi:unnamed protein product, partial [Amoebophrya sp. A25]
DSTELRRIADAYYHFESEYLDGSRSGSLEAGSGSEGGLGSDIHNFSGGSNTDYRLPSNVTRLASGAKSAFL